MAQSFGLVFALTAFCLLHADVSLAVWRAWWGYGVIVPVGMLVLSGVVGGGEGEGGVSAGSLRYVLVRPCGVVKLQEGAKPRGAPIPLPSPSLSEEVDDFQGRGR